MANEDERLRNIAKWRGQRRADRTVSLGDVVKELMESRISPQQAIFGLVAEIWAELLPVELRDHCEIVDIRSGELKVRVDSPAYVYELKLCSSELVSELRRRCSKARIRQIRFVLA